MVWWSAKKSLVHCTHHTHTNEMKLSMRDQIKWGNIDIWMVMNWELQYVCAKLHEHRVAGSLNVRAEFLHLILVCANARCMLWHFLAECQYVPSKATPLTSDVPANTFLIEFVDHMAPVIKNTSLCLHLVYRSLYFVANAKIWKKCSAELNFYMEHHSNTFNFTFPLSVIGTIIRF